MDNEVLSKESNNVIIISSDDEERGSIRSLNNNDAPNKDTITKICENKKVILNGHKALENGKEEVSEELENTTMADHSSTDKLFEKFIQVCTPLMKEAKDIPKMLKFVRSQYTKASDQFKASKTCRDILCKFIRKLESGHEMVFVCINDVVALLRKHSEKENKRSNSDNGETVSSSVSKKRIKLESISADGHSSDSRPEGTSGSASNLNESSQPSNSKRQIHDEKIKNKIAYYESLLTKFSDEIKRLQAHELSLEEMGQEDSMYIQEALLKKKFMKIFNQLCALEKVSVKVGRVTEPALKVTCSRFPEINRKVESYINKVKKFPDFCDIFYLVKQSNKKHNLQLLPKQVEIIAQKVFKEVGEDMKRRRHGDFVQDFGCYLTDPFIEKKQLVDPAAEDQDLQSKLRSNKLKSQLALQEVIEKYSKKQEEIELAPASKSREEESEKDTDCGSEPPSEKEEKDDDETDETISSSDSDDVIEILDEEENEIG